MKAAKPSKAILFDMDGVLVDVSQSYRKAIQQTVKFFSGTEASLAEIQQFKEAGGYNNDWDLTEAIMQKRGKPISKQTLIDKFQEIYLGSKDAAGLIDNEQWLLPKNQLIKLSKNYRLGIVTGRPRKETFYVLQKFGVEKLFEVVITMEDYPPEKAKPDPYPIQLALKNLSKPETVYVGDSVDDIAAAKHAGLRAFGCIPPGVDTKRLTILLEKVGAEKILTKITQIIEIHDETLDKTIS